MWAFAVWDQRRRELFCSRDRFGVKPFYYHLDDGVFVFASEIKAILPALEERPRPDHGVIADYLRMVRVPHRRHLLRRHPASRAGAQPAWSRLRASRTGRYWDYTPEPGLRRARIRSTPSASSSTSRTLRLRSDVPVGVALSGGLDSTAVLAEATAARWQPLHAFTAIFPGEPFDEHDYARLAARQYGAELHTVSLLARATARGSQRVIWHLDYPALLPRSCRAGT